jgi:hypothetical protein
MSFKKDEESGGLCKLGHLQKTKLIFSVLQRQVDRHPRS